MFIKWLGIVGFSIYLLDVVNILFFVHSPSYLLWYSSMGLLFTSLSLMTGNNFLMSATFCAFFIPEMVWTIGFLSHLLFKTSIAGINDYMFDSSFSRKDFYMSLYHLFIPTGVMAGIFTQKKVNKYAWVVALFFGFTLGMVSYYILSPKDTVNCIYNAEYCKGFAQLIKNIPNPYRIFIGSILFAIIVYIPSHHLAKKIVQLNYAKRNRRRLKQHNTLPRYVVLPH